MEELNPFPIDHETRETFIEQMAEEHAMFLDPDGIIPAADEIAWAFHEELWQISWELEAFYVRYVQGYRAARGETP